MPERPHDRQYTLGRNQALHLPAETCEARTASTVTRRGKRLANRFGPGIGTARSHGI
jgi:hypothetical protein